LPVRLRGISIFLLKLCIQTGYAYSPALTGSASTSGFAHWGLIPLNIIAIVLDQRLARDYNSGSCRREGNARVEKFNFCL
jgi:hypothetical protein